MAAIGQQQRFVKGRIPSWRKNRRRMFMFGIAQDRNMKFVSRHIYKATDSKHVPSSMTTFWKKRNSWLKMIIIIRLKVSTYNEKFIVSCSKCVRVLDVLCREMASCCGEEGRGNNFVMRNLKRNSYTTLFGLLHILSI